MFARKFYLARIAICSAVTASLFGLPAVGQEHPGLRHWHRLHHRQHVAAARPLTVSRRIAREPVVAAPDPYHGPAAIFTGPAAAGATVVSWPFQAVGTVFPARGNPDANPLVVVGAPVHVAGQVARLPFVVVGSAFGAPAPIDY